MKRSQRHKLVYMIHKKLKQLKKITSKYAWRTFKEVYQRVHNFDGCQQILFIVGSQRSGTTMLSRLLDRDVRSKSFDEQSRLSTNDPERLVWDPLPIVTKKLSSGKAPLVVAKPLVESHRIRDLLDLIPNSRAIWIYRHPLDVVSSSLKRFGDSNGVNDIQPILDNTSDWRSAGCSNETRNLIHRLYAPESETSRADAAALFWISRNQLFFDQNLQSDDRVIVIRYERFVQQPETGVKHLYQFLKLKSPVNAVSDNVSSSSVGKGSLTQLSPQIEEACMQQLAVLDAMASF